MSKKTLTTLIIVFSVIIIVLFATAFFLSRDTSVPPNGTDGAYGNLFPTEKGEPGSGTGATSGAGASENGIASPLPALRQITSVPVAGIVAFARDSKTYIRYIEKSTGNTYETDATAFGNNRLTNTTILRVSSALWSNSGSQVVIQYVDDTSGAIKNFGAKINESKNELEGTFLRDFISEIVVSPDTDKIFYTVPFSTDVVGSIANFDGTKTTSLFTSPFSEWLISWPRARTIAFTTKPSFSEAGYLYFLDTQTKAFDKILGDIPGLTALVSPDGKQVAYSGSTKNGFTFNLFSISDRTSNILPVITLTEKCVWANDNITLYCAAPNAVSPAEYPDMWYQGLVSFSDDIWKINTKTGFVDLVMKLEDEAREPIDVIQLTLSPDETYLIFINKTDATPWSLKLAS